MDIDWLQAERTELQRLIDACDPDDVSRISVEARLQEVEAMLDDADRPSPPE